MVEREVRASWLYSSTAYTSEREQVALVCSRCHASIATYSLLNTG